MPDEPTLRPLLNTAGQVLLGSAGQPLLVSSTYPSYAQTPPAADIYSDTYDDTY